MRNGIAKERAEVWRVYGSVANTLRQLERSQSMLQGSFYLLRRKCGKPNCRCARGKLHATWVLTRSEQGKDRLYPVPKEEQPKVRRWAAEYRKYQRARAALVKQQLKLLAMVDRIAEQRLLVWPDEKNGPKV